MAVKQILVGKAGSSATPLTLIKGDSNTQIIEMIVQRYYGGVDLGGLTWDVVFENAEEKSDVHYLTDIKVGDVNISCNWKPHGLATQAAGITKFQLEGYAEDNSGATAMVWKSGAYYFNVSDDMNYVPGEGENEALADVHKLIMYVDKELPGVVQAGSDAATAAAAANAAAGAANQATAQAVSAIEAANSAAASAANAAGSANAASARANTAAEGAEAARDNVRAEVDQLSEEIANVVNDVYLAPISGEFEIGSIAGDGNNINASQFQYRVRTKDYLYFQHDTEVAIADGFRIYTFLYDESKALMSSAGWVTSRYLFAAGSCARMVIARITEDTTETPDVGEFASAISTTIPLVNHVARLDNCLYDGFDKSLHEVDKWEQGSYNTTSQLYDNTNRLRVKSPVHMRPGAKIVIRANGQRVTANTFRRIAQTGDFLTDFEYIKQSFGWITSEYTYVSTDDVWLHFIVGKADETTIKPYELAAQIDLYDSYAAREMNRVNIEQLNYGKICVKTVAHRGDVVDAPENTISAYRRAVKNGYKYMETDVHFTADGVPVMLHDDTIDRTSNGNGNVVDFTLAQLKELDFGSWKSVAYAGEKIPTFEEMLSFCRSTGIIPFIELKGQTQVQVETLVNLVDEYGLLNAVHWISFSSTCLEYVRAVHADANLCFIHTALTAEIAETVAAWKTGKNEIGVLSYNNATENAAEICRAAGVYMMAGTITNHTQVTDAPAYTSWFIADGVNATELLYKNAMGN